MQYPNPIKLDENLTQDKPDYLNEAARMRNAAALPITDIRPDTNIESEIFPKELTQDAQQKEVFTPPNH